jgi:CBS domain-containing protein/rhodanese-related sulfurtransferase
MPTEVRKEDVRRLIESGAQLVEVLSSKQYQAKHLASAINIPLEALDERTTTRLRHHEPVIVYCYDYQCDMSARAAWRLESLGFTRIYRYAAGKADWLANGWPMEGDHANKPTVGNLVRRDVPTCQPGEAVCDVLSGIQSVGWDICVVVNDDGIVLGLLRQAVLESSATPVEEVMNCAPKTYRLDASPERALDYMREYDVDHVLVTTSDGRLIGVVMREDVEPFQVASSMMSHGSS